MGFTSSGRWLEAGRGSGTIGHVEAVELDGEEGGSGFGGVGGKWQLCSTYFLFNANLALKVY